MLLVITGASGSGKSAYAEEQVVQWGDNRRIYLAAMMPFGREAEQRIQRHRQMRAGKGFETVECYRDLDRVFLTKEDVVLLECMSNLTANEMFGEDPAADIEAKILGGVRHLQQTAASVCIVTNEVFSDGITYEKDTREYLKVLGRINQKIAAMADEVVEVCAGIPIWYKGAADK